MNYEQRVARGLEGLEAVSTGPCPGCKTCADARGMTLRKFNAAYEAGDIPAEAHFSWHACGICGSTLGGDREEWHAISAEDMRKPAGKARRILHFDDACVDCIMYLANGDLPSAENA